MRKYLLPAVVCAAIGALVLLFLKLGGPQKTHEPPPVETPQVNMPAKHKSLLAPPAETPTRLDEHKGLRELERTLAEGNVKDALVFRHQVCADIDNILANGKLTKDLLDTIRKYGIESDNMKERDVVLPMLRVIDHPEATKMIGEEYYRAKNEAEQMTLLEAMAKPMHDPRQASVWAVDKALNSPSAENRERAFDSFLRNAVDADLITDVAGQIYSASTDERQQLNALDTIAGLGTLSEKAKEFSRRILRNPRAQDVAVIMNYIQTWGDENDAARLEELAVSYPSMAEGLQLQARETRNRVSLERGGPRQPKDDEEIAPKPPDLEESTPDK